MYAVAEACIQLLFLYILNNYGYRAISNWEFHLIMWVFQCLLIWPIWWMAWLVSKKSILFQVITAIVFYFLYSYVWFGQVQDSIRFLHQHLQDFTRGANNRIAANVDRGGDFWYINYQLLKHGFRLSWFFLANYFYQYRLEEKERLELAIANKELQLKLLKWHLNPQFYFKTINHLREIAEKKPANCTGPILQLAKVMEYVIYEAKEKTIDVKKEIHFFGNYIELISSQPGSGAAFGLSVQGEYNTLRIAPLLLAAIVDKISGHKSTGFKKHYKLYLNFNGNQMQFLAEGDVQSQLENLFTDKDPLLIRLKELYPDNFSFEYGKGNHAFQLNVNLDEQD